MVTTLIFIVCLFVGVALTVYLFNYFGAPEIFNKVLIILGVLIAALAVLNQLGIIHVANLQK